MASEIDNLYRQIDRKVKEGDHETVAELANRVLHFAGNDAEAVQIKAVALLHANEYEAALKVIESNSRLTSKMPSYRAYCLYRVGRYADAQKIISSNATLASTLAMKHLQAQIFVKLGQFENAKKVCIA